MSGELNIEMYYDHRDFHILEDSKSMDTEEGNMSNFTKIRRDLRKITNLINCDNEKMQLKYIGYMLNYLCKTNVHNILSTDKKFKMSLKKGLADLKEIDELSFICDKLEKMYIL